jgi:hypothetical protein
MTQTRLHFVFTASGAGCLVQAIAKAGRHDQVIASFDDMSFGPINPAERSLRAKWVENEPGRAPIGRAAPMTQHEYGTKGVFPTVERSHG